MPLAPDGRAAMAASSARAALDHATVPYATVPRSTELRELPLPPSAVELLERADFTTVGDLDGFSAPELALELGEGIEPAHAARLLLMARTGGEGGSGRRSSAAPSKPAIGVSALALLDEERASRRLITFARELDTLLGGGVPLRQITEFAGAPGVGKTQLGMQLALNVQIPDAFGGLAARAVYIDSEGSFTAPRCLQMAEALVARLRAAANDVERGSEPQRAAANALEPLAMLDRIAVYRVHDAHEQLAVLRALAESAPQGAAPLRLVVVDSICFHLRHSDLGHSKRTYMLGAMAGHLSTLANRSDVGGGPLAAVCINQVTTKVNDITGASSLVPALGEKWAHVCNMQISLQWRDGHRLAHLYKGGQPGDAVYTVSAEGVRSCEPQALPPQASAMRYSPPMPMRYPQPMPQPMPQPPGPVMGGMARDENYSAQLGGGGYHGGCGGMPPSVRGPEYAQLGKRPADASASAMAAPPPATTRRHL